MVDGVTNDLMMNDEAQEVPIIVSGSRTKRRRESIELDPCKRRSQPPSLFLEEVPIPDGSGAEPDGSNAIPTPRFPCSSPSDDVRVEYDRYSVINVLPSSPVAQPTPRDRRFFTPRELPTHFPTFRGRSGIVVPDAIHERHLQSDLDRVLLRRIAKRTECAVRHLSDDGRDGNESQEVTNLMMADWTTTRHLKPSVKPSILKQQGWRSAPDSPLLREHKTGSSDCQFSHVLAQHLVGHIRDCSFFDHFLIRQLHHLHVIECYVSENRRCPPVF